MTKRTMKNATAYAKKLSPFLKKLVKQYSDLEPEPMDPLMQLVMGFLEWEATHQQAIVAHTAIMENMIDGNDLRITHVHELVHMIGEDYPLAYERIARMRDALMEIYRREHDTNLASLPAMNKKQVKTYLETLPGMVQYVEARTMLLSLDSYAIPVDGQMTALLQAEGVVDEEAKPGEVASFLERQVKAAVGLETFLALRQWTDEAMAKPRKTKKKSAKKAAKKKAASKKTAKRTTKKKVGKKK